MLRSHCFNPTAVCNPVYIRFYSTPPPFFRFASHRLKHPSKNNFNEFITKLSEDELAPIIEGALSPYNIPNDPKPSFLRLLAVKDNIATSDSTTTCASKILKEHQSPFEATVVQQFRKLGSAVIGKTNMDEFGMGSHSTNSFAYSVFDNSGSGKRSVGGSSGGSAQAVAKGKAQIAIGTDTGGSVRLPAAYTGIVGFKPSYGMISRWGVVPYANSLDTVGILAPSSSNLASIFTVLNKHDPKDPTSVQPRVLDGLRVQAEASHLSPSLSSSFSGLRIGVPMEYNIEELEPDVRQAWTDTLILLHDAGATVVPVSLPNTKHALSAYYVLAPAEAASNLSKYDGVRYGSRQGQQTDHWGHVLYSSTRGRGFAPEVQKRILLGTYTLSSAAIDNYFIQAQKVRRLVQRDFDRVFSIPNPLRPSEQFDLSDMDESILLEDKLGPSQIDFILSPTAPTLPPTLQEVKTQSDVDRYMNDVFTVPASLAGLPALSLPVPIPTKLQRQDKPKFAGVQIIGQYGDDYRVIDAAGRLEKLIFQSMINERNIKEEELLEKAEAAQQEDSIETALKDDKITNMQSPINLRLPTQVLTEHNPMLKPRFKLGQVKISKYYAGVKIRREPGRKRTQFLLSRTTSTPTTRIVVQEIEQVPPFLNINKFLSRPRIRTYPLDLKIGKTSKMKHSKQLSQANRVQAHLPSRIRHLVIKKRISSTKNQQVQLEFENVFDKWAAMEKENSSEKTGQQIGPENMEPEIPGRPRNIVKATLSFFTGRAPSKAQKGSRDSGQGSKPGFFG